MNIPAQAILLTQKFTTEFSCIGNQCEDDCCQGWSVSIDEKSFKGLRKLYRNVPRRRTALKRNKDSKNKWDYGFLDVQPNKPCSFLNKDGLCDVHKRHGSKKLGWVCNDFPRRLYTDGEVYDLTVSMACPEMARLCLLQEYDASEIIDADPALASVLSGYLEFSGTIKTDSPYSKLRKDVRHVMLLLANARQYEVSGCLYLLLYFAFQVDEFFHLESEVSIGNKLEEVVGNIADPSVHSELVNNFLRLAYDPTSSISVIHSLISLRFGYANSFNRFVKNCFNTCNNLGEKATHELSREELAEIIKTYFERREIIDAAHISTIDEYFRNYLTYYLFNRPYTRSPSLARYLRDMLCTINVMKFLFYMNPSLDPLCDIKELSLNKHQIKELLDKAVVEACYQCVRRFEHLNPKHLELISDNLESQGLNTFDGLAMLAKT